MHQNETISIKLGTNLTQIEHIPSNCVKNKRKLNICHQIAFHMEKWDKSIKFKSCTRWQVVSWSFWFWTYWSTYTSPRIVKVLLLDSSDLDLSFDVLKMTVTWLHQFLALFEVLFSCWTFVDLLVILQALYCKTLTEWQAS